MSGLHGEILAGGISSRMGFPKALMPIGDSFFLLSIYTKLVEAGAAPVHIVINTGLQSSLNAQMSRFPEARFVLNREPAHGQIHSLRLGLAQARDAGAAGAMVALVDQPLVAPSTVRALAEAAGREPDKLVVPRCGGKRGHPYVVPAALFGAFTDAAAGATARDVLDAHAADAVYVEVNDEGIHQDVDTPEDMARLSLSEDMD